MLLGDAGARDERGLDIEKTEDCVLDGERIRDERTANRRGARIEAFGRGLIRESEERPSITQDYIYHNYINKFDSLLIIGYHTKNLLRFTQLVKQFSWSNQEKPK